VSAVKRYRFSPVRGLVEDDGGIYPIGVSQPMVTASDYDDVDRERMLAQGYGRDIRKARGCLYPTQRAPIPAHHRSRRASNHS
jgi:hypothetical protein